IARLGGVPRERVEALLGRTVPLLDAGEVRAPGTLESHYAPHAIVELCEQASVGARLDAAVERGEKVGVVGARSDDPHVVVLGVPSDGDTYAHDLYRMLRAADAQGLDRVIAVVPDPNGAAAAVA